MGRSGRIGSRRDGLQATARALRLDVDNLERRLRAGADGSTGEAFGASFVELTVNLQGVMNCMRVCALQICSAASRFSESM